MQQPCWLKSARDLLLYWQNEKNKANIVYLSKAGNKVQLEFIMQKLQTGFHVCSLSKNSLKHFFKQNDIMYSLAACSGLHSPTAPV